MNDAGRIGFVPKGTYNPSTVYEFLDVVYYGNSSYVAKKVTSGNTPSANTDYWQILATGAQPAGPGTPGTVMPDGTTLSVTADGVISAIVIEKDGELATSD